MTDDPDVRDAINFLREREVVHYQRFGEGLRIVTDHLDDKNFYAFNPSFDRPAAHAAFAPVPGTMIDTAAEKGVSAWDSASGML